jgi:flagellar hook-basal body complex protein FliE
MSRRKSHGKLKLQKAQAMSDVKMDSLLGELRRLRTLASGEIGGAKTAAPRDFGSLFESMLNSVNNAQGRAAELTRAFEFDDNKVDLAEVMIMQQKARLSFQTVLQVRNKLVSAYQEIMNMPI